MTFFPSRIVSTIRSFNSGLRSLYGSVYLGVSPPGWLSTWNHFTWESGHNTFWPRRIVSTIGYVNSGFCSCLGLSSWEFFHLDVSLFGFCPLGNLCT